LQPFCHPTILICPCLWPHVATDVFFQRLEGGTSYFPVDSKATIVVCLLPSLPAPHASCASLFCLCTCDPHLTSLGRAASCSWLAAALASSVHLSLTSRRSLAAGNH
jgi:hypothetical protein